MDEQNVDDNTSAVTSATTSDWKQYEYKTISRLKIYCKIKIKALLMYTVFVKLLYTALVSVTWLCHSFWLTLI